MMRKPLRAWVVWTGLALLLSACGGSRPREDAIDPDKADLINALTLFVEAVQADRFDKAFGYLTPAERSRMLDAGSEASVDIQRRLKALRLSTLAQRTTVRLRKGLLEGIHDQLPDLGPMPSAGRDTSTDQEVPLFQ